MRTTASFGVLLGIALGVAPAHAQNASVGKYDVKFEDVSTNCTTQKLTYRPAVMEVKAKGSTITIDLDLTPLMVGTPQKNGKLSAKSKAGNTMVDGMQGVFSVAGKVAADGSVSLVMVAEYSTKGKALCSQSWNVTGTKQK
jgi:hypothetical protein